MESIATTVKLMNKSDNTPTEIEYKVYNSTGDHGGQLIVHHDVDVTFEIV